MISKILLNNNPNNFYQIQQDYEKARKSVDKKDETSSIFDIVPQVQKAEQLQNTNSASTPAIATLALLNAPEDIRDMQGAYKQISSLIKGEKFIPPYDYKKRMWKKSKNDNFSNFFKSDLRCVKVRSCAG